MQKDAKKCLIFKYVLPILQLRSIRIIYRLDVLDSMPQFMSIQHE
jgi:hypothetical protein